MKALQIPLLRLVLLVFSILAFGTPSFALNLGNIVTIAGNGVGGDSGDGGPATSASLSDPAGVVVDSSGNLFIADSFNNRIRKVAAGTGIITTVAGNGAADFSGDNDAAISASLNFPAGVAVDSAGNLYIADSSNNRIRKVAADSGIITTLAGGGPGGLGDNGPATSASLNGPTGVAIDSSGNLYIADSFDNRIRKIAVGTGIITTVAGNGADGFAGDNDLATSASLNLPTGVAVDNAGNLYIADYNDQRIRKVAAGTGLITTVAGTGTIGVSGDGGLATSANLGGPAGVAVDSGGNFYFSEQSNNRVRMVDGNGIITTVAGNGTADFAGDNGPATSASLYAPFGVTIDSFGNLFIADQFNNRVRKVYLPLASMTSLVSSASDNTSAPGVSVTFTAAVTSSDDIPAGSVTFRDGGTTALGNVALDENGQASFTTSTLTAGSHTITAVFGASGSYNSSTSPMLVQKVGTPIAATGAASAITAITATLNGTVNDNGFDTAITFQYGLTTDYGSSADGGTVSAGTGSTAVNASISGLNPVTSYHFRVVATNEVGTTYGNDATFTTGSYLSMTFAGNGSGSITASAPGYLNTSCDKAIPGSCTPVAYQTGTLVSLLATPDWKSSFIGWNGVDNSLTNTATVTMSTNKTVTATFDPVYRVNLLPDNTLYTNIQDAYTNAAGTGGTIQAQAYPFPERLVFANSSNADITLSGGLDATYNPQPGFYSTVQSLIIQNGKVIVRNIKIMP